MRSKLSQSFPFFSRVIPLVAIALAATSCEKIRNLAMPAKVEPRTLRLGHDVDIDSPMHASALQFAAGVEKRTNGRLKINVFPRQELGTDHAMVEMARTGELDFVIPPTSKMSGIEPSMQILDLPFFYQDQAAVEKIIDGRVGQRLLESVNSKGLYGLALWQGGWKHFTSNFPVSSPADFAGKKMRVMRSPMIMAQFSEMSALPIAIDFAETYNALKDKQVDGQENPLSSIFTMRFYEVQSHLTLSRHGYLAQMLVASAKTMESLTPEEREAVIQEAKAVTPSQRKSIDDSDVTYLEKIKASGIQITELTDEQRNKFREVMTGLIHQFMDDIGADVVKMAAEDLGITLPRDESIVVAINADLTGKSAIAGQAIARGVTLAVNEINRSGGIDGKKIRVREMDHQAVAARSSEHMDKIMTQENVRVVFGGLQSAIIIGDLPKIAELGKSDKVFISSWATAEAIINNRLKPNPVFRVSAHDKLVAPFLARQAVKRGKKVALLLENSAWGRGNHEELVKALKSSGVRPKREEFFNADQKEFVTELKAIEDSGAEVLLMVANPAEAKEIVKAMIARPRKIPIIAHWGFTGGTFGADLAEELKSVDLSFLQTNAFVGNTRPLAAKVAAEYLASYGGTEPIDILAAAGVARAYDAMRLAGIALEAQAKKPKLTLIKAMEEITGYEGVVASYKYPFKGQREALDTTVYRLGRYDGSGRIVPLERQK